MALKTAQEVMATAEELTSTARAAQTRLDNLIQDDKISARDAIDAQDDINAVRLKAAKMARDAMKYVVDDLQTSQSELTDVIKRARERLEQINDVRKILAILEDLVGIAVGVVNRKPGTVVSELRDLRRHLAS